MTLVTATVSLALLLLFLLQLRVLLLLLVIPSQQLWLLRIITVLYYSYYCSCHYYSIITFTTRVDTFHKVITSETSFCISELRLVLKKLQLLPLLLYLLLLIQLLLVVVVVVVIVVVVTLFLLLLKGGKSFHIQVTADGKQSIILCCLHETIITSKIFDISLPTRELRRQQWKY